MCKPDNIRASIWLDRRVLPPAAASGSDHGRNARPSHGAFTGSEVLRLRSRHPECRVVEEVAASTD